MKSKRKNKTVKRLSTGIITVIVMTLCLAVTTYAYMFARVSMDQNVFQTGTLEIFLSGGEPADQKEGERIAKPVIQEQEFLFEPGMTVVKDFYIENIGTGDAYYKLYFENVTGDLADVLEITIKDEEDQCLYEGYMSGLNRGNAVLVDDELEVNQIHKFKIIFFFPEEEGNNRQAKNLIFELKADAVQTRNNDNKEFE